MAATPTDNPAATRFRRRFPTRLTAVLVGGMFLDAGLTLVGAILSQWLAPETKGKSLTETAAGFSH